MDTLEDDILSDQMDTSDDDMQPDRIDSLEEDPLARGDEENGRWRASTQEKKSGN
jgi:hypothetical protein